MTKVSVITRRKGDDETISTLVKKTKIGFLRSCFAVVVPPRNDAFFVVLLWSVTCFEGLNPLDFYGRRRLIAYVHFDQYGCLLAVGSVVLR